MTAPRTPVEALAVALHMDPAEDSCDHETHEALLGHTIEPECVIAARDALAHLPEGWSLISAPTLAARLHEACRAEWASMSARDRAVITQHGPDAHLGEARGLLSGGGE